MWFALPELAVLHPSDVLLLLFSLDEHQRARECPLFLLVLTTPGTRPAFPFTPQPSHHWL